MVSSCSFLFLIVVQSQKYQVMFTVTFCLDLRRGRQLLLAKVRMPPAGLVYSDGHKSCTFSHDFFCGPPGGGGQFWNWSIV